MKSYINNSISTCTDEEIMSFIQEGNTSALSILIQRYKADIARFAYHYSGDYSTAIDVARDTFVTLFQTASNYTSRSEFSPWVFSITLQLSLSIDLCFVTQDTNCGRKSRKLNNNKAVENLLFPNLPLHNNLVSNHVQQALCGVADVQRAILILRDIFLFPYTKIALITDCEQKTVEALCEQGRQEFRSKLRQLHVNQCMPN